MSDTQRPGYPKTTQSPEVLEAKMAETMAALKARYGDRLLDTLEADVMRKEFTYEDYLEIPALLSLQTTLTEYHDEKIFKVYHQQTELWFSLVLHELQRAIRVLNQPESDFVLARTSVERSIRYFDVLTSSYSVLIDGLSTDEFLMYRKAFGTSSGFQSAQFRAIEIVSGLERMNPNDDGAAPTFYWERAARHLTTNEPTLTLTKFKERHLTYLNALYENREPNSLRIAFLHGVERAFGAKENLGVLLGELMAGASEAKKLADMMIDYDMAVVNWKQEHFKVVMKHMPRVSEGTGGTNWKEYLANSIKQQRFFPELHEAKDRIQA